MQAEIIEDFKPVINSTKYLPCISLLMPFEPKMGLKKELDHKLKIAQDKIERELRENYPPEKSSPVLMKLKRVISELNYYTHKKSIAIFVSPLIDKVYYLDIAIEQKIIIDETFEIRDLVFSKKEIHKYLLVVLTNKQTKIYLGNTHSFIRITTTFPEYAEAYKVDYSEKVANFSDENKKKEILLNKFLMHTDNGLSLLLKSYNLPLFVMGTTKTIGYFNAITRNSKYIVDFIHGSFEDKTESELSALMRPKLEGWKKIKEQRLLTQIDDSLGKRKLAVGMKEVWKAASEMKGRLLIVEKNYIYPAEHGASPEIIYGTDLSNHNAFYIKDAVDEIIEKVISSGGDVEFVDEGVLKDYQKIVLIEYYGL